MNRVVIFLPYFGRLPSYFRLWLTSCAANPDIHWVVISNDATYASYFPANVKYVEMTFEQFRGYLEIALQLRLTFTAPYKICDFRPAFSCLLPLADGHYDFWGHCDADMIFGQIRQFIPAEAWASANKIFTVGHLTLYRNEPATNGMYRNGAGALAWDRVLSDERHLAFDEHLGVNRIWSASTERVHRDESVIADMNPRVHNLQLIKNHGNSPIQCFFYSQGHVFQSALTPSGIREREFMYIHFQKRKMALRCLPDAKQFTIRADGFYEMVGRPSTISGIWAANPLTPVSVVREAPSRIRSVVRKWRADREF